MYISNFQLFIKHVALYNPLYLITLCPKELNHSAQIHEHRLERRTTT